ncbi:hypothetical protein [Ralstonia mannitolilytica]|uniref:hypothetical protein n=1 Tax=Ralstonia mannitolilytica TaxID=105219 RepID=UPI000CEE04C5|nr:hypothetical protein [Ralstonia mannitolilytica]
MSVHSFSHQIPAIAATAELPFHPLFAQDVSSNDETWDGDLCDTCGASVEHHNLDRDFSQWLGQGDNTDWCQLCGAEREHWHEENKQPLSEWSLPRLLREAFEVELAYIDYERPMTNKQVDSNRSYLKRLIQTIASSNLYHVEDRSVEMQAWRRWDDLRQEAAELFDKVCPSLPGLMFYKYASDDYSESELRDLVCRLRAELAELESAASEQPA